MAITPWFTMQLDLVRCLWAVLPAAILWGASFPLALASVASPGQDPARLVGGVYAANTRGRHRRIAGREPRAGRLDRQPACAAGADRHVARFGAAGAGVGRPRSGEDEQHRAVGDDRRPRRRRGRRRCCWRARVPEVPGVLIAYGRYTATRTGQDKIIYKDEGMTASVAVSRLPNGVLNYHNAGKIQASSQPEDMRLQRMLGHLTTLVPDDAKRVVVIGCGAGVTAGAVSIDPSSRTRPSPRSSRSCRASSRRTSASTTSTSSAIRRCTSRSTMDGTTSRRRGRSSTRSRPIRWIRG